jgi:hypothetical protein
MPCEDTIFIPSGRYSSKAPSWLWRLDPQQIPNLLNLGLPIRWNSENKFLLFINDHMWYFGYSSPSGLDRYFAGKGGKEVEGSQKKMLRL